jgi:hypothetical protein
MLFDGLGRSTVFQDATVQITVDHLLEIRTKETVSPFKPLFIHHLKRLKVVFYALVVWGVFRMAPAIYGFGHEALNLFAFGGNIKSQGKIYAGFYCAKERAIRRMGILADATAIVKLGSRPCREVASAFFITSSGYHNIGGG